jgi:pSer/pThr/pTyr-binding forkhead associated (FHA) protein
MEVQLKVVVGSNAGQVLKVPGPKFFIGRAEDCHLRPGSDLVSRHHCVLMIEGDSIVVRDFGSKNGTLINDERVQVEAELKNGDRLKVGPLEFEVLVAETAKRPKVTSVKEAALRTAQSVGSPAEGKEIDIGDWIGGADDTTDTRAINRGDTAELEVKKTHLPDTVAASDETTTSPSETTDKRTPGKLPPVPKSGDSHNAAAEMLKRLKKR